MGGRRRCGEQRRALPVARSRTDAAPRRVAHGVYSPPLTLKPRPASYPHASYPHHTLHRCGVTSLKRTCSASATLPASSRRGSPGGEPPICPSHWSGCTPPRRCRSERLESEGPGGCARVRIRFTVCLRVLFCEVLSSIDLRAAGPPARARAVCSVCRAFMYYVSHTLRGLRPYTYGVRRGRPGAKLACSL